MIDWNAVPQGHRGREYLYGQGVVRCRCQCRWLSALARSTDDARRLWVAHIRSLVQQVAR